MLGSVHTSGYARVDPDYEAKRAMAMQAQQASNSAMPPPVGFLDTTIAGLAEARVRVGNLAQRVEDVTNRLFGNVPEPVSGKGDASDSYCQAAAINEHAQGLNAELDRLARAVERIERI